MLSRTEEAWYDLAAELGESSAERLKETLSATEFWKWQEWLKRSTNKRKPEHSYLAQIAYEVHCVLMNRDERRKVTLENFLLDFTVEREPEDDGEEEEKALEARIERSKGAWLAWAGVNKDGTVKGTKAGPSKVKTRLPEKVRNPGPKGE